MWFNAREQANTCFCLLPVKMGIMKAGARADLVFHKERRKGDWVSAYNKTTKTSHSYIHVTNLLPLVLKFGGHPKWGEGPSPPDLSSPTTENRYLGRGYGPGLTAYVF